MDNLPGVNDLSPAARAHILAAAQNPDWAWDVVRALRLDSDAKTINRATGVIAITRSPRE